MKVTLSDKLTVQLWLLCSCAGGLRILILESSTLASPIDAALIGRALQVSPSKQLSSTPFFIAFVSQKICGTVDSNIPPFLVRSICAS